VVLNVRFLLLEISVTLFRSLVWLVGWLVGWLVS